MEDYDKSKDDAQLAWTKSNGTNLKAAYRLGKTLISLNDYDGAITCLEKCLQKQQQEHQQPSSSENEIQSLHELLQQAQTNKKQNEQNGKIDDLSKETTIKGVDRPISIREFKKYQSLGVGNFSEIVVCEHKVTHERFALKILEKKTAADLAKRQHPNVYNEIAMEARVLLSRIPPTNPYIVVMYHSFQDYNNLYYLMDLHNINPDLWSRLRYNGSMVGCHPSQIKRWMMQLISAVEHCHAHGIVHRDLKPEKYAPF
jgi:tetratricopeptide (TPR) repeat protein